MSYVSFNISRNHPSPQAQPSLAVKARTGASLPSGEPWAPEERVCCHLTLPSSSLSFWEAMAVTLGDHIPVKQWLLAKSFQQEDRMGPEWKIMCPLPLVDSTPAACRVPWVMMLPLCQVAHLSYQHSPSLSSDGSFPRGSGTCYVTFPVLGFLHPSAGVPLSPACLLFKCACLVLIQGLAV